jgi:hypothetical protein
VEKQDPKHFAYVPTKTPVAGEDGDCKVLRHTLELEEQGGYGDGDSSLEDGSVDDVNDMVGPATVVELQARDVVQSMLDTHESQIQSVALLEKVIPYVEYDGNQIYKSTLEHSQPSPCIRALQKGDTGSMGMRWMVQGHLRSRGSQPSPGVAHGEGPPDCHGGSQCHPIIVPAPPLPYCAPILSLPPPPSPVSLPASPLCISKVSKE